MLIECPNCGKHVSDTAEKCVHCGHSFAQSKRNYNSLSMKERGDLKKEFYRQSSDYDMFKRRQDKLRRGINISYAFTVIFMVCFLALTIGGGINLRINGSPSDSTLKILITFLIISFVGWIVSITAVFVQRKVIKKHSDDDVIIEKKYKQWLSDVKGLDTAGFNDARLGK